jgi:hypothetical protein
MILNASLLSLLLLSTSAMSQTEADRRFKLLQLDEMTAPQKALSDSILNGPRRAIADPNVNRSAVPLTYGFVVLN